MVRSYECLHCDKVYTQEGTLKKHIKVNHQEGVQRPKCDKCQKIFKDKDNLSRHVKRIHYKVDFRKWKCDLCDKYFGQQGALFTHNKIHSGIKHPCTQCGKQFTRKDVLLKHL